MGDYFFTTLRAALFAFALYTTAVVGLSLADNALSGHIWHTLLKSVEVIAWIYIAFDNVPPWWTTRKHVSTVAMDDSV
jgi:hypothetical protein